MLLGARLRRFWAQAARQPSGSGGHALAPLGEDGAEAEGWLGSDQRNEADGVVAQDFLA